MWFMKIAFHEITGSVLSREVSDDGWFPHADVQLVKPVDGSLSIRQKGDQRVLVKGNLQVLAALPCDRCGQSVPVELCTDFDYECIVGEEEPHTGDDTECREEDCYRLFINEPVIDLDVILREQVYLALPVSMLCQQSCQGLCTQCGADLNRAKCSCSSTDSSSPFAVLRQLKGK
jgi:uncharacterized protein